MIFSVPDTGPIKLTKFRFKNAGVEKFHRWRETNIECARVDSSKKN